MITSEGLLKGFLRFTDLYLRSQHLQMLPALRNMSACPVMLLYMLWRSCEVFSAACMQANAGMQQ